MTLLSYYGLMVCFAFLRKILTYTSEHSFYPKNINANSSKTWRDKEKLKPDLESAH